MFLGINYAAYKLPFLYNADLSVMLAMISIGQWYLCDHTKQGFILSLFVAIAGTGAVHLFVYSGVYWYFQFPFFLFFVLTFQFFNFFFLLAFRMLISLELGHGSLLFYLLQVFFLSFFLFKFQYFFKTS